MIIYLYSYTCFVFQKKDGYPYNCSVIPLFELGSLHHDFYLLNIRLPVDHKRKINVNLGHIADMWLFVCIALIICYSLLLVYFFLFFLMKSDTFRL